MTVFDVIGIMMPVVEAVMVIMLYEAFLKRREEWLGWSYGSMAVLLAVMIACVDHFFQRGLQHTLLVWIVTLGLSMFYQGAWRYRFMCSVLSVAFVDGVEWGMLAVIAILFSTGTDSGVAVSAFRFQEYCFLGMLLAKFLGLAVCSGLYNRYHARRHRGNKSYWLLFVLLCFSAIVAVFLIFKMTYEIGSTAYNGIALFSACGLFVSTFFALYLYGRLERQGEALHRQEQFEQHLKFQEKHLDEILLKQQDMQRFRHDLRNQFIAIKGYFARSEVLDGEKYIDALMQGLDAASEMIDTGNTALDAVLSSKLSLAQHKGITVEHHIRIAENLAVDPVDLCVIFGNALDNAIEACDRLETADKRIVLDLRQEDNTLFCQLANTALPSDTSSLATSKPDKDNHGFGFANLAASLEKYGGAPLVVWENGWFILSFMLFMSDAGQ